MTQEQKATFIRETLIAYLEDMARRVESNVYCEQSKLEGLTEMIGAYAHAFGYRSNGYDMYGGNWPGKPCSLEQVRILPD